jgi:transposase
MPHSKSIDFTGQDFYVGIDVHKKSWTVTVRTLGMQVAHFTQPPQALHLNAWLRSRYPGGTYLSAYEAGFCGTSHHQHLCDAGIKNIIIHPADLPMTNKQKTNKTDLHDSRSIASYLQAGVLSGIFIMSADQQQRRALFRCRQAKVKDVTRCINRLRSLLYFLGVQVPDTFSDKEHLSNNFLTWLTNLQLYNAEGTLTLNYYIDELKYQRRQLYEISKQLKAAALAHFGQAYTSVLSVPGFGPITAIGLLIETGDLNRFAGHPADFTSYLGLVPAERSSGDSMYSNVIQPRCNRYLRPLLIEAAWVAIRRCPVLLNFYKKHVAKGMNGNKAIVKIARKLALTARAVAINHSTYKTQYSI